MGKQSKKASKDKKGSAKSRSSAPTFNEEALSALTAKLEQGFEKGFEKGAQEGEKVAANGTIPENSKSKMNKTEPSRGKKRDANGSSKAAGDRAPKRQKTATKDQKGAGQDDRAILLKEILALGGTEEDLDLVAGIVSDDEDEVLDKAAPQDKVLRKELSKFVEELGLKDQVAEDAEDEENELEQDDWEEASGSDDSEASGTEEKEPLKKETSKKPIIPEPEAPLAAPEVNDPNRLVFEARPDWHAAELPILPSPELDDDPQEYENAITALKSYAVWLLEADSTLYASKNLSASSSHRFLSTIMTSGTLSDKVSALTLVVQESPVHTTKSFESLLGLASKRSRGQAVSALGALKDLLAAGVVLPADRRLRAFAAQPGLLGTLQKSGVTQWSSSQRLPGTIRKAHLISWAYEDWLKTKYFEMLKILEGWCTDEIEYSRTRAVTYVYELLKEKPEQEANLLRLLVNKLGDPEKKIASRTSYLLLQLQTSHPLMKLIIIRSIETELLLRPGQSSHAIYYAINTLNQTILGGKEEEVAKKLLAIYFDLFVSLLKKPEPLQKTGPVVNRKGQIQGGGAPMGRKAIQKAKQEEEAKEANVELKEKMISAVLSGVNRAMPFSNTDDQTLENHMDTLYKITHSSNFNTSLQALMLIEQLSTAKHVAVDRYYRTLYESLLDPRLITSSKHALYLNLLFRSLKADLSIKRVKAFAKRMLQIITLHQPPFICGILYLLSELEDTFPGLKTLFTEPEADEDDDEEVFRDVPEDGAPVLAAEPVKTTPQIVYDGRKRDPQHCNADKTCLWESLPFLAHFHPSVALFAERLIKGEKFPSKPDLASYGLSSFLDRFVYRNAKAPASGAKGGSIMQPLTGADAAQGVFLNNKAQAHTHAPVNTEAFWKKKAEDVSVDEVFFHKYFNQIGKGKESADKKKKKGTKGEDDVNDDDDSAEEDEIWEALKSSRPDVEGPSDDDESDMDLMDLGDSDAEISDGDSEDGEDGGVIIGGDESDAESFADFGEGEEEENDEDEDELFKKELQKGSGKEGEETKGQKKKRLSNLPTFASVEDYAAMLDQDEDEEL